MTTEPPHIASSREQTFILIPAFGFDSERNARKYLYSMKGNREYTDFVFHQRGGVQSWYVTRPWAKEEPAARRFLHTDILSEARRGLPFQSAVLWRKKAGSLPEGSFHTCLVVSGKREIKKARPEDIGQYAYMEWMCDDSRTKNSASIVLSKRIFAWRYGRGALYSRHTQTSASGAITGTVTRLLLLAFQIFDQDRSRDHTLFLKSVRFMESKDRRPDLTTLQNTEVWTRLIENAMIGFEAECDLLPDTTNESAQYLCVG